MRQPIIEVSELRKHFGVSRSRSATGVLRAVDGASIQLHRGETLGLVGESGCGKSTLARVLLLLERPTSGEYRFDGIDPLALRGRQLLEWRRRIQMVFQDPFASLNPRLTVEQIVAEPWLTHRDVVPKSARSARVEELLSLVGLTRQDAARHPGELSGGQQQRVGIARALASNPEVLICDEPVSALDLSVQAQVLNLLRDLQDQLKLAYLFISHDLSVVRYLADRVAVMYLGSVVESGPCEQVLEAARHPYTAALVSARPQLDDPELDRRRIVLDGEIPSPLNPPSGCRFRTRCWQVEARCERHSPELLTNGESGEHKVACHFPLAGERERSTFGID